MRVHIISRQKVIAPNDNKRRGWHENNSSERQKHKTACARLWNERNVFSLVVHAPWILISFSNVFLLKCQFCRIFCSKSYVSWVLTSVTFVVEHWKQSFWTCFSSVLCIHGQDNLPCYLDNRQIYLWLFMRYLQ